MISTSKDPKRNNAIIRARVPLIDNSLPLLRASARKNGNLLDRHYGDFPIIMLRGDKDGKEFNVNGYCPIKHAKKLFHKLKNEGKNIEFITVSGGHTIFYEQPEYVMGEIRKVLSLEC